MKTVALFYGGRSFEHEISVLTAMQAGTFFPKDYRLLPIYMLNGKLYYKPDYRSFSSYIKPIKAKEVTLTNGGLQIKRKYIKVDCALVCTHGGEGEDGTLSALLEYYDVPYTATNPRSSGICMDKSLTKTVLRDKGFNVVEDWNNIDYPCIIKPCVLGSSIGISVVNNSEDLLTAQETASYFGEYIIEPFLVGSIEYNCAIFTYKGEYITSVIEKPLHKGEFLNFDDKYKNGDREIPASMSDDLQKEITETTIEIYKKLSLFGVVRVDYLYYKEKLYVNEINTIPGSLAYYLFSDLSINFEKLLTMLIEEGISRGTVNRPQYGTNILKEYAQGFKGNKSK